VNEGRPVATDLELHVSADPLAAATAALVDAIREADESHGSARLAIPGGSAATAVRPTREALGEVWRRVRLTWTDERCVPFAAQDSNRGTVHRDGSLNARTPTALELPLFEDGEDPAAAVRRVSEALGRDFDAGLDVLLLGMGGDGHIASLFPNRQPPPGLIAHVPNSPKPPADRMTLTVKLLSTAKRAILLATGEGKREALARLAAGDPQLPATRLTGLAVFTDQDVRH
jgi:6-phosphogluconolactonase